MPNTKFDDLRIDTSEEFLTTQKWNDFVTALGDLDTYAHRVHLAEDGKVGIGKIAEDPMGPLHILQIPTYEHPPAGLSAENNGLMMGSSGNSGYKWIQSYGGSLSLNPKGTHNFVGIGTTAPSAPLTVANDNNAQIEFLRQGASGAIEQNEKGGALRLQDTENKTKIQLRTYGDSYFNGGNIGIGTAYPKAPLHILVHSAPPDGLPQNENGLLLGSAGPSKYKWIQSYGGSLILNPKGDQNHVGIGVTDPKEKLHVGGNTVINGSLQVNGVIGSMHIDRINIGPWRIYQSGGGDEVSFLRIFRKSGDRVKELFNIDWDGNIKITGKISENEDLETS